MVASLRPMRKRKRSNPKRDRIELRAEPEWIDRVVKAANRMGLSISGYIRVAVNKLLDSPDFGDSRKNQADQN